MRCATCTCSHPRINGDGPRPCSIMLIGEAPGREENAGGRPFIGQSGRELNDHYLKLAGLTRSDVYLTNTVKCHLDGNRTPRPEEVAACAESFLHDELRLVNPSLVILMGATACSLVAGEGISLETHHGLKFNGEVLGHRCQYVPMYHPAAGLHDTAKMIPLIEDWKGVVERPLHRTSAMPDYRITEVDNLAELTKMHYQLLGRKCSLDTETVQDSLWSMQVGFDDGGGSYRVYVYRVPWFYVPWRGMTVQEEFRMSNYSDKYESNNYYPPPVDFTHQVSNAALMVVMHNALADMRVWNDAESGVGVNTRFIIADTMQMAYNLGLPQKLKVLAYRICGLHMTSYEDLVSPWSLNALGEWLDSAIQYTDQELSTTTIKQLKTKSKLITKPAPVLSDLKRIKRNLNSPTYDPFEKAEELSLKHPDHAARIFDHCGMNPVAGIHNVPWPLARKYAADDAVATLMVHDEMARMSGSRNLIHKIDKDK